MVNKDAGTRAGGMHGHNKSRTHFWNYIDRLADVPPHLLKEIELFFSIYKELEKKKTGVEGWEDQESAIKIIKECQQRYKKQDT